MGKQQASSKFGLVDLRHPQSEQSLTLAPTAGCCGTSWMVHETPHLHLNQDLPTFLAGQHTGGLPLLYPWANRLRKDSWSFRGTTIDLAGQALVHRDSAGRPMHGVLLRWPQWRLIPRDGGLSAELDWGDHEALMAAFPFPHSLRLTWTLNADGLEVETTITAAGHHVPVSFGWHPYLILPGAQRGDLTLQLPELRQILLDDAGLPGNPAAGPQWSGPYALAAHAWDHAFSGLNSGDYVDLEAGSRRLRFETLEGYRFLQIYSPEGADYVCIEPMTATTAALNDQVLGSPVVDPYQEFTARFRLSVR